MVSPRWSPAIAATDYVRGFADQIRAFVPMRYTVLGTDGFGRSDTRANLRRFVEVDRYYIAHAAIAALVAEGKMNVPCLSKTDKRKESRAFSNAVKRGTRAARVDCRFNR